MNVSYSRHLTVRLKMRGIPESLPGTIYLRAKRRFFDRETNLEIAVSRVKLQGKTRDVMVAYLQADNDVMLITIHPLKRDQLRNRIRSGRWEEV